MKNRDVAAEITLALKALGRGSRQGHRPSAQEDFGVYTGDLRRVVGDFKVQLKGAEGKAVHELALQLLGKKVTECRQVAYELIAGHKAARELLDVGRVERLGQGLDNWACVDNFCAYIAGKAWLEGRIPDAVVERWAVSSDLWWRRVAVVSTVALNNRSRGGRGDPSRTLMICERVAADPEIMVQKAISWALRMLVPWDREAVEGFLNRHRDRLSSLVLREVTRKLRTGKKN
ncbi:MAG: DNA alkylation repair protein [Verrucomicrobiales bacterium]|nr:DNA alkylation repair protein [Verrucomicrobiales bacterium]